MDVRVKALIALMDDSYHQELSVEAMARTANLSPSYLSHLFKAETGLSPLQYLKSVRMSKAKELMENTFLNVKEVMHRVGVKDKCHFARDFKKAYGMAPTEFRTRCHDRLTAKAKFASK